MPNVTGIFLHIFAIVYMLHRASRLFAFMSSHVRQRVLLCHIREMMDAETESNPFGQELSAPAPYQELS